ncbi:MAG: non-canonical purine NTP pyrophosphatase [Treponema sp.]|jgi:XTP/dITP diphosphohydrolase|nr:non-canonical purine NTP pyrophosphatase [Treponema sp.]
MAIWFASGNIHKKNELTAILGQDVKLPTDAGLAFDPQETGCSFLDNALIKARELIRLLEEKRPSLYKSGDPVIADDSGLCVDALGGRPGIYSARYSGCGSGAAQTAALTGKKLTDSERNALLLSELGGNPLRSARFVCAMVLLYSPDRFFTVQETLEGEIVSGSETSRGEGGFGYDPILYIPALGRTAAELSPEEKNSISHRGKAGRALARFLE